MVYVFLCTKRRRGPPSVASSLFSGLLVQPSVSGGYEGRDYA